MPVLGGLGVIVIALVIVGLVGGSNNGGDDNGGKPAHKKATSAGPATTTTEASTASTTTTPAPGTTVSLALRSTADVWVCLVDNRGRALVNSETLTANQSRGPFDARGYEVTFGNGSIEMTVNGQPEPIPAAAQPLSYRITSSGVKKLSPGAGPSCV